VANLKAMVSALQSNMRTIKVSFTHGLHEGSKSAGKLYTYKTRDESIKEGDWVVVFAANEYKVCYVHSVDLIPDIDVDAKSAYKWVVQKVDPTQYDLEMQTDQEAYQMLVEAEKKAQREKVKEMFVGMLDQDNSEVAAMLTKLEGGPNAD